MFSLNAFNSKFSKNIQIICEISLIYVIKIIFKYIFNYLYIFCTNNYYFYEIIILNKFNTFFDN